MNFQDFLKYVPNIIPLELPAVTSHLKMAPKERIEGLKNLDIDALNARMAGVMMLFYPKEEKTYLVLIVRNTYKGVHSAQIAFPGGKFENDDLVAIEKLVGIRNSIAHGESARPQERSDILIFLNAITRTIHILTEEIESFFSEKKYLRLCQNEEDKQ